jgi:hypothetical protein
VMATHTRDQLDQVLDAFKQVRKQLARDPP